MWKKPLRLSINTAILMAVFAASPVGADDHEADFGSFVAPPLQVGIRAGATEMATPWVTVPPCPEGVSRPAGAVVSGRFYVIGGESTGGDRFGLVQEFDPAAGTWDDTNATMPIPGSNLCAAVIGPDIYIPGGYDGAAPIASLQIYHTTTDTWETVATDPVPFARSGPACASYGGRLFVFGGNDGANYLATGAVYDPLASPGSRWSTIANAPIAGAYGAAIAAANGIFYAGMRDSATIDYADVLWYDPMANSWTPYPSLTTARGGARLWTYEGKLAVGGGGWGGYFSTVEEYDLSAGLGGNWLPGNPLNVGRRTFAAAQDDINNTLYAGAGWAGALLADSERANFMHGPGANVLVSKGYPYQGVFENIYGGSLWPQMTATLNEAANSVTVTVDLEDMAYIQQFDAIWVDQRGTDGDPSPFLSVPEIANIATFITTGRRVVMFGENSSWTNWNNQILGICGGGFSHSVSGAITATLMHELTDGVVQVDITSGGAASGGVSLFDENLATLWPACGEVLTILDVNSQNYSEWDSLDNAAFYTNVAEWISFKSTMPFADGFESGDTSAWSSTNP